VAGPGRCGWACFPVRADSPQDGLCDVRLQQAWPLLTDPLTLALVRTASTSAVALPTAFLSPATHRPAPFLLLNQGTSFLAPALMTLDTGAVLAGGDDGGARLSTPGCALLAAILGFPKVRLCAAWGEGRAGQLARLGFNQATAVSRREVQGPVRAALCGAASKNRCSRCPGIVRAFRVAAGVRRQ
jgi:hypothetical protein